MSKFVKKAGIFWLIIMITTSFYPVNANAQVENAEIVTTAALASEKPGLLYSNSGNFTNRLQIENYVLGDGVLYGIEYWADGQHGQYEIKLEGT